VNTRAVRLFGFVLRHRRFERQGAVPLEVKRYFEAQGQRWGYALTTRGYHYRPLRPVPVEVLEGTIRGKVKQPPQAQVRKPGVDYGAPPMTAADAATPRAADADPALLPPAPPSPTIARP
jgi:hypothetical protein